MNIFKPIRILGIILVCLFSLNSFAAQESKKPEVFDLRADWKGSHNPNGVWSIHAYDIVNQLSVLLAPVDDVAATGIDPFPVTQPGLSAFEVAPIYDFTPVWFKTYSDGSQFTNPVGIDWQIGDIVVHTGRTATITIAIWTSPDYGVVDVLGAAWAVRDYGRFNVWAIFQNNNSNFTTLGIVDGDGSDGFMHTRSNPAYFEDGVMGTGVLRNIPVAPGDTVKLALWKLNPGDEDYVGVDFKVVFTRAGG